MLLCPPRSSQAPSQAHSPGPTLQLLDPCGAVRCPMAGGVSLAGRPAPLGRRHAVSLPSRGRGTTSKHAPRCICSEKPCYKLSRLKQLTPTRSSSPMPDIPQANPQATTHTTAVLLERMGGSYRSLPMTRCSSMDATPQVLPSIKPAATAAFVAGGVIGGSAVARHAGKSSTYSMTTPESIRNGWLSCA